MAPLRCLSLPFLLCSLLLTTAEGAAPQGSRADYERAASLRARTQGKVRGETVDPSWLDGGARLWYRHDASDGHADQYVLVDCASGEKSPLFDPARLAQALAEATGRDFDAGRLPLSLVVVEGNLVYLLLAESGEALAYDRTEQSARSVPIAEVEGFRLSSAPRIRRSRSGRGRTALWFANGLDEPLQIFWIDEAGRRHSYGEVAPGGSVRQDTHVRHAWVLVDAAGTDRAAFVAEAGAKVAWVDADTPAPQAEGRSRGRPPTPRGGSANGVIVRDHNVWVVDPATGEEVALSDDGTEEDGFRGRPALSPDGKRAVVMRTRAGDEREVYYVEAAPRDQLQPKVHSYSYLKPGDRLPSSKPHLFDLEQQTEIPLDDALYDNPYSIRDLRWATDGSHFTFLYNQRGHQVLRIVAVDAETGTARALIDETTESFIDYSQKQVVRYLGDTGEILWSSERDGWNHLYLYDASTGQLKNRVTEGPWVVRGVERIDEEKRQVWLRVGGIHPEQDPYHVHYARASLDGGELVVLTEGDGTHTVSFSPDGRTLVDRYSRADLAPVTELRRSADGALICELERADWSELLATGWRPPQRFAAKGRDGVTDIWGIIRRPTNHDPAHSYPVIEAIYAGPHGAHVPKSFRVHSTAAELAELGFIVVQIDGMGTNHRSKAFHDVCWQNIGDAGFPDRILWMRAAAQEDSSLDLTRVGIYGGSAGGQNALRALLAHGDFYHAAVADCGCHDNRMDKIWWNEAWMGWPIEAHYEEQSNVTQAHRLEGKLLLTVGAMDENVDPASTMQVVQALIDADKDFDLIVFPRGGHGIGESPYGRRRRRDFFVRHLLKVEPRWEAPAEPSK